MSLTQEIRPWQGREAQDGAAGWPQGSDLTPGQLELRRMVLASVTSPHSRRNYAKALDLLFSTNSDIFVSITTHSGTISALMAAVGAFAGRIYCRVILIMPRTSCVYQSRLPSPQC